MKKLALVAMIFIFASFTNASAPSGLGGVEVDSKVIQLDGMTYRVFTGKSSFDNYIDIAVINVTKEKLEIEKLKAEIAYYKSLR